MNVEETKDISLADDGEMEENDENYQVDDASVDSAIESPRFSTRLSTNNVGRSGYFSSSSMEKGSSNNAVEREVYTLGQNSYGELGHGDTLERHLPTLVEFCRGKDIVQVSSGNEFTILLDAKGEAYGVGYNDSGQCGSGGNGRCVNFSRMETMVDRNVVSITTTNGSEHLLMVTDSGELYTNGYNSKGQLGHGNTQSCYVPKLVEALSGFRVTKVCCSYYHSIILTDSDQIFSFGRNDFGQLGLGDRDDRTTPSECHLLHGRNISALACGQYHSIVGLAGGGLMGFGKNDYGQLGLETTEFKLRPTLVTQPPLNAAVTVQLACGYYHTIALVSTGLVFGFGRNDYGQLGIGNRDNQWKPHLLTDLQDKFIREVTCGCYHSICLSREGKVYPFGRNNHGQLGTNNTVDSARPLFLEAMAGKHVCQITAGFYHTVLLVGPPLEAPNFLIQPTLSSDFRGILNNPARSDVTFVLEGRPIYAHRIVIMARCEPLERMLDGPMKEATEQEIVIPEHRYEVFLGFLEFLYTDVVTGLEPTAVELSFALDLLTLADQFLVDALKRKCEAAVQKSITIENVSEMFVTADSRQALALRKKCFDFMLQNFGKVIATKSFSELPPNFIREVCLEASKRGVVIPGSQVHTGPRSSRDGPLVA